MSASALSFSTSNIQLLVTLESHLPLSTLVVKMASDQAYTTIVGKLHDGVRRINFRSLEFISDIRPVVFFKRIYPPRFRI